MEIPVEKIEETSDEIRVPMPTIDEMLGSDGYMQSTLHNIQANTEADIYDQPNVFSIHGLLRELRSQYTQAVFINPGTSIEDKIEDLKNLPGTTVILCSDICFPGLVSAGVRVDYVVTLDPNFKTSYFLKNLDLNNVGVIASSASPIHQYFSEDTDYYLFNSLEETSDFVMRQSDADPSDPNSVYGTALMLEKSRRINEYLRDAGILRRFTQFLARGTVSVTMFQIADALRLPTLFYGFDFYIREKKPYAEFIAKAVHEKIVKDGLVEATYTYDDYVTRVINSYYEDRMTPESLDKTKYDHPELGVVYVPTLLYLYKELFLRYIKMVQSSGKNMKFV